MSNDPLRRTIAFPPHKPSSQSFAVKEFVPFSSSDYHEQIPKECEGDDPEEQDIILKKFDVVHEPLNAIPHGLA